MFLFTIAAALAEPVPGVHAEQAHQFHHNPPQLSAPTLSPPPPEASSETGRPSVTVYGYHAYWTGSPLDIDFSRLTHVAVFNIDLNSDGTFSDTQRWTNVAADLVPLAHSYDVHVHLCFTSFTDSVTNAVLSSPARRATAIAALASMVEEYGADGVNVDIEGLDASQRNNFVSFIEELSATVDEVVIATPAVDWLGAFDYDRLAALSDGLFIMGYGYHYSGGDPGPIAPLYGGSPWGRYSLSWTVEDYRTYGTPDDKIILGLPLYGREWPTTDAGVPGTAAGTGEAVVMSAATRRAAQDPPLFDTVTRTPYILYPSRQLWYDDVASVRERVAYAVDEGLQGIGFWALQYEGDDPDFWPMITEETVLIDDAPEDDAPDDPETPTEEDDSGLPTDTGSPSAETDDPPVALAGRPFTVNAGDIAVLNGTASYDPEGDALTYQWRQLGGPAIAIEDAQNAQPRAQLDTPGVYRFELTVRDGAHFSSPDTVEITAQDPSGGCSTLSDRSVGGWVLATLAAAVGRRRRKNER